MLSALDQAFSSVSKKSTEPKWLLSRKDIENIWDLSIPHEAGSLTEKGRAQIDQHLESHLVPYKEKKK